MDVNKVILLGRLVKDPVRKELPSGQEISVFSLATNYLYKDEKNQKKESVEFHSIILWGRLAEVSNEYLTKGSKVYVEGRLKTRTWEDENKEKHYKTEVVVNHMNMLGGGTKKEEENQDELAEEEITVEEVPMEKSK